jgi:hypothetical protein
MGRNSIRYSYMVPRGGVRLDHENIRFLLRRADTSSSSSQFWRTRYGDIDSFMLWRFLRSSLHAFGHVQKKETLCLRRGWKSQNDDLSLGCFPSCVYKKRNCRRQLENYLIPEMDVLSFHGLVRSKQQRRVEMFGKCTTFQRSKYQLSLWWLGDNCVYINPLAFAFPPFSFLFSPPLLLTPKKPLNYKTRDADSKSKSGTNQKLKFPSTVYCASPNYQALDMMSCSFCVSNPNERFERFETSMIVLFPKHRHCSN